MQFLFNERYRGIHVHIKEVARIGPIKDELFLAYQMHLMSF